MDEAPGPSDSAHLLPLDSVMGYLVQNPSLSKFKDLVITGGYADQFSDAQNCGTVFALVNDLLTEFTTQVEGSFNVPVSSARAFVGSLCLSERSTLRIS